MSLNTFSSKIDPQSPGFARNREAMQALIDEHRQILDRAEQASEKRRTRFEERGQLTPRERLSRLLDPGMPFLELYGMANYLVDTDNPERSVPGGNSLCGIGFVSAVRCMIMVDDSGIDAGAMKAKTLAKGLGVMDIALKQKLPLIHLVESAGANLMDYEVALWAEGGGIFCRLAQLSAAGIPTVAVLHGPSTAGGAYMPGMSDYTIAIKGRGMAALAGPALLYAATGEVAAEQDLGGAEMHASVSGLAEYLAEDDAHGLAIAREVVAGLNWNEHCALPEPTPHPRPPVYATEEIVGTVPVDYRTPYDVHEVMARLADGSELDDFKSRYGVNTICTRLHIHGLPCAMVGNNGPIDPDAATKVAQFLQLCDQARLPVIFLHNTTGYMVGTAYEHAGMIKHGSKMIQAVSNIRVPRIALHIGASFGAGNYGMSGLGYNPDFILSWPNSRSGVMGGEQAAKTMSHVARQIAKRRGQDIPDEFLAAQEQAIIDKFDGQSSAFYTSGRCLDMGVIDPRDSRKVLAFLLETCREASFRSVQSNSFGVARM